MLTLYLSYNYDSKDLVEGLKELPIKFVTYSEDKLSERKKSFRLKGSFGTRLTPFAVLYNEDKIPLKAFYSDSEECTLDNIKNTILKFN